MIYACMFSKPSLPQLQSDNQVVLSSMNLLNALLYIKLSCVLIVDVYYGLRYVSIIIRIPFICTFSGCVFLNSHVIGYTLA
jgi:hypothetical protein